MQSTPARLGRIGRRPGALPAPAAILPPIAPPAREAKQERASARHAELLERVREFEARRTGRSGGG
jgi:hypothetical protein